MLKHVRSCRALKGSLEATLLETEDFHGLAKNVLVRVVIESINKYQQKLNVGIQDSVSDLLDDFKQKVAQQVAQAITGWNVVEHECELFPPNCRFFYQRGLSTIAVIEQQPQLRSLLFDVCMLGTTRTDRLNTNQRVMLSLPYVVFIVHFKSGEFCNLLCGWRLSPLTTLDDVLLRPTLPNMHDTLGVCTGSFYPDGKNIAEKCTDIVSQYWNSQFNNDLSNYWWHKSTIDRRLASAKTWEEESCRDANFILTVNFENSKKTLRRAIDLLVAEEQEPDRNAFRHNLIDTVDKAVEGLFIKIMRYFKKTKFEVFHPKDVTEALQRLLQEGVAQLTGLVKAMALELDKLEDGLQQEKTVKPIALGEYWKEYSS